MNLEYFDSELRWATIEPEIERFQSFLAPDARRLLIERNTDVLGGDIKKGVYLLFDSNQRLLYVGVSLDKFGNRFKEHRLRFEWKWADLIVFPDDIEFFAPALEAFLIRNLLPPMNSIGNYV